MRSMWVSTLAMLGILSVAAAPRADVITDRTSPGPPVIINLRQPTLQATVIVTVQGVASPQGQITALLYATDDGFPAKEAKAKARISVPASVGAVTLHFQDVPAGTYAVTVYHDANGNGRLDTNWIGIPKEPVAVSNNAKGRMGPPKFKDAKFVVDAEKKELQISLVKI